MFNFLSVTTIEVTKNVSLNWIGKIIRAIIEKPAYSTGIGVILFTLILKLITLPFDVISRVASKNNALKMEKMRPELERLKKQYKNNSQLYQKKVMALQKKSGYSPLSSCLPSILSIVIFIFVINAFTTYSRYSTNVLFKSMAKAYNTKIEELATLEDPVIVYNDTNKIYEINKNNASYVEWFNTDKSFNKVDETTGVVTPLFNEEAGEYYVSDEDIDNLYKLQLDILGGDYSDYFELQDTVAIDFKETDAMDKQEVNKLVSKNVVDKLDETYLTDNVISKAQSAAKGAFKKNKSGFLWVKNIWVPDTSFRHPLESFSRIKDSLGKNFQDDYYVLTGSMKNEKKEANGFYILVVISIGIMFLSQWVAGKEQQSQIELGSVEGKDSTMGQTQKYMKIIMPLMFGVFAFIYTSAFSVYMIVSSLFTTVSTLIITKIVTKIFEKKVLKEELEKDSRLKFRKKN